MERSITSCCCAEKSVLVVNGECNKAIEVVQGDMLQASQIPWACALVSLRLWHVMPCGLQMALKSCFYTQSDMLVRP